MNSYITLKDCIRFSVCFIFLTSTACSTDSQKTTNYNDSSQLVKTNTITREDDATVADFRKEFISLYQKPVLIDTFFSDNGKKYEAVLHYFCTMDNALIVPARHNFDLNKDFVTHNFVSDFILLRNKDTVIRKQITKATFNDFLDTSLKRYATLLYPNLSIHSDSLRIDYSISIPVTDVGIGVAIEFDKKGNYVVSQ